jgi:predicted DNA-binding transcriptional regulator AlpA
MYVTVKKYAELKGITKKTVYNRIKSGEIPKDKVRIVLNTTLIKK